MIVFTIILGLSLYPSRCFKADDAIIKRNQARNSQLYYSANYQPSQDRHDYEASQNNNYNNEPSPHSNYNIAPRQNSNNNIAPSQNSNYNYEPSPHSNYNIAPRQNSNYNIAPSQNSNYNYEPSPHSNYNIAPSQNSNYNYAPRHNSNYNYAPSQNSNYNNKQNFNSYGNATSAAAGLYNGRRLPSNRQPHKVERYYGNSDAFRDPQVIGNNDRYKYPVAYNAEIGGTPVPMFRAFPRFRPDPPPVIIPVKPHPNNHLIPAVPLPPFQDYPIIFPSNQNEVVGFGDIESRTNDRTAIPVGPGDLGFDGDPDLSETEEQERFLWQVSVFSKEVSPRARVCGGSLVTSSAIISAARCFWAVGPLAAGLFAVGSGEVASGQAINYEAYQYQRNVRDIKLPPRFRGVASSFQDDLAVVLLAQVLPPALKPVCVSFDWELDDQQLAEGSEGMVLDRKVEGWNLALRNQKVPYIGVENCLMKAPGDQLRYITSDKICAGFLGVKSKACSHDIGSGLVYFQNSPSIPFLRGVASLSLGDTCVTAFTHVGTHRAFLLRHINGLEGECARHYPGAAGAVKEGGGTVKEGGDERFVCNCYC